MNEVKKYIGYRVEAGSDLDFPRWFVGYITYFDGENIIIDRCTDRLATEEEAWKGIANTLKEWERNGEIQ